jgi:hypothetical protein
VPGQHTADAIESRVDKGKKGDWHYTAVYPRRL